MKKRGTDKKQVIKKAGGSVSPVWGKWISFSVLTILTLLVFSNSLVKKFIELDDQVYILDNPFIKSLSWESISKMFSVFYNGNYHPLTTLLFAIEYSSFKTDASSYHLVSLIIHILTACHVFILLEKLSLRREIAIIGSLLFAIHPMHVESVVWISEQKDVLYAFFLITGLFVYVDYVRKNDFKKLVLVFFLFLLSALSKSSAVIFPLLLVLVDYYLKRGATIKVVLEKIPFLIIAFAFGVIAILSQREAGAIAGETMIPYTFMERIFVVSFALVYYIIRLILPIDLAVLHYAPPVIPWYYYLCPVILILLTVLVLRSRQMKRELVFGFLFYLFSIILVIQIIPIGFVIVSERYSYVPYIGLFFIVGQLYLKANESKSSLFERVKPYLKYFIVFIVLLFSYLSYQYNKKWENNIVMFKNIIEKNPTSAYANFTLGKMYSRVNDTLNAVNYFNTAIGFDTSIAEIYFCRANIYFAQKKFDAALSDYSRAERLKPVYQENLNNMAFLYSETGRMEDAIYYYGRAILIKPTEYLYMRRATCYTVQKKYDEAMNDYSSALNINPESGEIYFNRGVCYYYLQQNDKACSDWKNADSRGYEKARELLQSYCK